MTTTPPLTTAAGISPTEPAADERDGVMAASGVPELNEKIWFHKTASAVIEADRCVGCGGCIAACPSQSISIAADGKPTLTKMCTGCSACWDYCPEAGLRVERLQALHHDGVSPEASILSAWSARAATPNDGQDGGVVTAMLVSLLESGEIDAAIVTRREDAFRGKTLLATTATEIRQAAGSVYHQTEALDLLNRKMPAGVERIAYVGTPCQVSVLRALQGYPWPWRESAAPRVTLAIALFCTRSFDPFKLMQALVDRGEKIGDIERLDIREGTLFARDAKGSSRSLGPVREFRGAGLGGCDECADFTGNLADLSVGNVGSQPGASTVLVRTETGARAWEAVRAALDATPAHDLSSVELMAERNKRRAIKNLQREYDPTAALWITYSEHQANYEGTERASKPVPSFRSHHYDVSC